MCFANAVTDLTRLFSTRLLIIANAVETLSPFHRKKFCERRDSGIQVAFKIKQSTRSINVGPIYFVKFNFYSSV